MRTRVLTIGSIILFACSVALSSEGEAAATEQGIFGGSFADALWTVLAFVVLMLVLGKFAWKPVINGLKARESHIQQQIEAAAAAQKGGEAARRLQTAGSGDSPEGNRPRAAARTGAYGQNPPGSPCAGAQGAR